MKNSENFVVAGSFRKSVRWRKQTAAALALPGGRLAFDCAASETGRNRAHFRKQVGAMASTSDRDAAIFFMKSSIGHAGNMVRSDWPSDFSGENTPLPIFCPPDPVKVGQFGLRYFRKLPEPVV